jgi:hypothetical protein
MIFNVENIASQVTQLLHEYPDLVVNRSDSQMVCLHGKILVFRTYNDFTLRKTYTLAVNIPIGSDELPFIVDTGRHIRQDYQSLLFGW